MCLIALGHICIAQDMQLRCKECSTARIYDKTGHVDKKEALCFLYRFKTCKDNVEYMEYANPLLFDILLCNSKVVVELLIKYPALSNKYLHNEIQHPLLDCDVKRIIAVVDSSNNKSEIKQQILDDLKRIKLDEHGYPK